MLQTQVNYWNLKELERHNRATENYYSGTLTESQRHNLATEKLGTDTLNETVRHNQNTEQLNWSNLAETVRHNQAFEVETNRHNVATENETHRHNVSQENIGWYSANTQRFAAEAQAATSRVQAYAALSNAETNARNADINQQNANTNTLKNWYYQDSVNSQIALNQANTDYTNAQRDYLGQKNTREWIGSIGGAVGDVIGSGSKGFSLFKKIFK